MQRPCDVVSRIEGGTLHPNVQAVDLTETIITGADRVGRQWPALAVHVRIADEAPLVRADPAFLDRTIANCWTTPRRRRRRAKWGRGTPDDLSKITQPTLVANGDNDRMVPSTLSEDLHRRIEGSELIIYPDSGHGGIFQFHDKFAPVAVEFLGR